MSAAIQLRTGPHPTADQKAAALLHQQAGHISLLLLLLLLLLLHAAPAGELQLLELYVASRLRSCLLGC